MGVYFSNWIPVCIIMALNFITRAVFLYQGGMPEPDSIVMAAGMAQWFTSHINFGDAFL